MKRNRLLIFLAVAGTLLSSCGGCDDDGNEFEILFSDADFEICGNNEDDDGNGLVDCDDRVCQRKEVCRFQPEDPTLYAPAPDVNSISNFYQSVKFLVEGENALVRGVNLARLDTTAISVVRARILDRDGNPLAGVRARIAGASYYGYTYSRADGWADFIVNAKDESVVIRFDDDNVLGVDSHIETERNAFANGRDVVATELDSVGTAVKSGTAVLTDASDVTDTDGTRKMRAFIQPGTRATVKLGNGQTALLDEFTVRATEYTVGGRGPDAMPGLLPELSAYTYAVEMSIDEVRDVEIDSVTFDKPVSLWVNNFLDFPVGSIVPSGTYDRGASNTWEANTNGRVIGILAGGLDVDGDQVADRGDALAKLGITTAEQSAVLEAYQVGDTLWRAPVVHFSPHDLNWPVEFPEDAVSPDEIPDFPPEPEPDPCTQSGSIIECENRVVAHAMPVPGTDFTLWYRSDRVPGRGKSMIVHLSGDQIPESLKRIEVIVRTGGKSYVNVVDPAPNLDWEFEWDGINAYGQPITQEVPVSVQIDYVYEVRYAVPADVETSFGISGQDAQTLRAARVEARYSQKYRGRLGGFDNRTAFGMGGWALDLQSFYDGDDRSLVLPDRPIRQDDAASVSDLIRTFTMWSPPEEAGSVTDMFALPNGEVLLITGLPLLSLRQVFRMDTRGNVTKVAGQLEEAGTVLSGCTFGSDCGEGADPSLWKFSGTVDLGPDGALYFMTTTCTRRLDLDTMVYEAFAGFCGEGGYDNEKFVGIQVAACESGVYAGGGRQIFRIKEPFGSVEVVAGTDDDQDEYDPSVIDGAVATDAYIDEIGQMVCSADGGLFWLDKLGSVIELQPDGRLRVVWANDGQSIWLLQLIESIEGGPFTVGREDQTVKLWKADGNALNNVAGASLESLIGLSDEEQKRRTSGDNIPAVDTVFATLYAVTQFDDGRILIQDTGSGPTAGNRYREIIDATPSLSDGLELIDPRGNVLTVYDAVGRPVSMRNVRTNVTLYSFAYDSQGRLSSIKNALGKEATIERDTDGSPTAIVGYFGMRTGLTTTDQGFITGIDYADGTSRSFGVTTDGLIERYTDGRGNQTNYTFSKDGGLARVERPDGTWKAFAASRRTIIMTTSDGREIVYANGDSGEQARATRDAAGLEWQYTRTFDGESISLSPDGVVRRSSRSDDPRFGRQARYQSMQSVEQPNGLTRTYEVRREVDYDPTNLLDLVSARDIIVENGKEWVAEYDAATRILTRTSPAGRTETISLDDAGRVLRRQVGAFDPVVYTHGDAVIDSISLGNYSVGATYENGFVTSLTSADGQTLLFTRDAIGRVSETREGAVQRTFGFDADGDMTSVGLPAPWLTQTFDELHRLDTLSWADAAEFRFHWGVDGRTNGYQQPGLPAVVETRDSAGRLVSVSDGARTQTYTYDPITGQLGQVETDSVRVDFTYDGSLRTVFQTTVGGVSGTVEREFDESFRVVKRKVGASVVASTHDDDGLQISAGEATITWNPEAPVAAQVDIGGFRKTYTHDNHGLLTGLIWSGPQGTLYDETLSYDLALRLAGQSVDSGPEVGPRSFTYGDSGELLTSTRSGLESVYTYDVAGNRLSAAGTAQTYDLAGRLESVGGVVYSFDTAGRLASRQGGSYNETYAFDGFNRLLSVQTPGELITYGYDGVGRLTTRATNGAVDFVWLYDDSDRPHAELDAAGNLRTRFVYADSRYVPAYMQRNGETYVLITDHMGTVHRVADSTGNIVQELTYDPWGRILTDSNPGFQPFAFAGGLVDPTTGLMIMGVRQYDPLAGRWISADPSGLGGGINPWVYAANAPTMYFDPNGENPLVAAGIGIVIIVGGAFALSVKHTAYGASDDARKTGRNVGSNNGPVDALRHCTMNCRMTRSYGLSIARAASWYHESPLDAPSDNIGSDANLMDEHNNACGQDVAEQIPPDQGCENGCEEALLSGKLDMLPSSEWGDNEAGQVSEWTAWQKGGVRSERYGAFN